MSDFEDDEDFGLANTGAQQALCLEKPSLEQLYMANRYAPS